jgi:DNA-binding transcriptional ArsR family regulator
MNDTGRISERVYQNLPETIAAITREVEDGRERDVVLTGALPVVAGALQDSRFYYGEHWHSLNLYTAVIAPAAKGKGKMRHARKIGEPLNEKLHEDSKQRLQDWRERRDSDEQEAGSRPEWQRFFLSADSSASKMKEALAASPHGVIFETEFKTLSNVLEQDWGQFRDVLLKGFQNEPVEVERQRLEEPQRIEHPAPSMAVSGTPGTFSEVISDTEDGLFSRFAFYQFEGEASWKNQFGSVEPSGLDHALERASKRLKAMYREQSKREDPLYVTFSDQAPRVVNELGDFITEHWKREGVRGELNASLRRAALRSLRIAGVLRLLRHHEQGHGLHNGKTVEVGAQDLEVGLRLAFTYLTHSLQIAEQFGVKDERQSLRRDQIRYLEALPNHPFETEKAKEIAGDVGVNQRTAQRWLKKWAKETGLVEKIERGKWEKIAPDRDSDRVPGVVAVESAISVFLDDSPSGDGVATEESLTGGGSA